MDADQNTIKISEVIKEIQKKLSRKANLKSFANLYFNSIPERSQSQLNATEWAAFFEERFSYFSDVMKSIPRTGFRLLPPKKSDPKLRNSRIFEYVCPDATYLLLTFEALFRELDIRITRVFHPIMTVNFDDNGKLESVEPLPGKQ